jgi:hypothetical protein
MISPKWDGFMPMEKTCLSGVAHAPLLSKNVVDEADVDSFGKEGRQHPNMSLFWHNFPESPPAIGWLTGLYMWEQ